jgi:glycosyltransferase involved in cell wall biosynthesis
MQALAPSTGREALRILCVTLNYARTSGGTTVSVANFSDALGADVLSFTSEPLLADALHGPNIRHIPVPDSVAGRLYGCARSRDLRQATELARGYDMVFCHMLFRSHNDWVAQMGMPYFIVPHGSLDPYVFTYRRLRKELWLRTAGARFFRRAEAVIFATRREQQRAFRGTGRDKSTVITWPVTGSSAPRPCRDEVRRSLGATEDDRVLLSVGRLHSMKRPLETIEAFAAASQEHMHLVIVGPEEQYSACELQTAAARCRARNVHVTGPIFGDAKWAMYSAADGYISLSARENFGYTAAEAMCEGLPLILSPGNNLGYELANESCGWLLGTETREDAARAIREFGRSSPEALRQMGERAKRWVQANASFDSFKSRLCGLVAAVGTRA